MVSRLSGRCESGLSKKNEHKPRLEHVCVQPGLCLCFYALQCTACDFQSQFTGFGARPPTSIFVFVYTNALLARSLCLKKLRSYLLKIVLVFSLSSCGKQCLWLSIATNRLLGCTPIPDLRKIFCGYAFDECYIKQFEILERAYIAFEMMRKNYMVILSFADAS